MDTGTENLERITRTRPSRGEFTGSQTVHKLARDEMERNRAQARRDAKTRRRLAEQEAQIDL